MVLSFFLSFLGRHLVAEQAKKANSLDDLREKTARKFALLGKAQEAKGRVKRIIACSTLKVLTF